MKTGDLKSKIKALIEKRLALKKEFSDLKEYQDEINKIRQKHERN